MLRVVDSESAIMRRAAFKNLLKGSYASPSVMLPDVTEEEMRTFLETLKHERDS